MRSAPTERWQGVEPRMGVGLGVVRGQQFQVGVAWELARLWAPPSSCPGKGESHNWREAGDSAKTHPGARCVR